MRFALNTALIYAVTAAAVSAQTPAELKTQADYEKVVAETEKARADTAKVTADRDKVLIETEVARIGVDNATLAPLRGMSTVGTSLTASDKTAEALILHRVALAGVATKLVSALRAHEILPGAQVVPVVVIGTTPPNVSLWLTHVAERQKVQKALNEANTAWQVANGPGLSVAGAVAIASTILPMLKTETSITGASQEINAAELEQAIYSTLARMNYGTDYSNFALPTEAMIAELMGDATAYNGAVTNLADFRQYGRPSAELKAAGEKLEKAVNLFETMQANLRKDTSGVMTAATLARLRAISEGGRGRPVIYITSSKAAITLTAKKGFFTGIFGSGAPQIAGVAILDYVTMLDGSGSRGTVSCSVGKTKLKTFASIDPQTVAKDGTNLCL